MKLLKNIAFSLLAVVVVVMVYATCDEKVQGMPSTLYGSWRFASLWALLAVTSLIYILRRKMHRRPALLLLHLSFAVILVGALITHVSAIQGSIHLRQDCPTFEFVQEDGQVRQLPFMLELNGFEVVTFPGTETPMDFVSEVSVCERSRQLTSLDFLTISMNHIGEYGGYRFYQSSYDDDGRGSILAVSYDPLGIGVTYVGYGLLFVSMLLLLMLPHEGFRQALRKLSALAAIFMLAGAGAIAQEVPEGKVLPDTLAERFGNLYCYYNGRICPLQTVAHDFTVKLYGKSSFHGYSAEQVFTGWMFFPTVWSEMPRKESSKPQARAEQDAVVQMLLAGEFARIYPYEGVWYSQGDNLPMTMAEEDWFFIKKSMDYAGELAVMKKYDELAYTLQKIRKYQVGQMGDSLPSDAAFQAEKFYNRWSSTKPLAMAFLTLGILLFFVYLRSWLRGQDVARWLRLGMNGLLILAFLYQAAMLSLRWYVSGHLPLTNGFETMQFMALVTMGLTLALQRRFLLVVPFGVLLTGLTLLVSMMGQSNPQITPLMPVLSSPLLSIHVCIIMLAYSLLAFTFFNGLTALFLHSEKKIQHLMDISRVLLFPALFCMAAGIFIGAIWANVSWSRYWGWDPKEVWALITLLIYSLAMHGQSLPWFRNPRHYHLFMVLAFLSVLMTYFGVNFILGGMHSYAAQ